MYRSVLLAFLAFSLVAASRVGPRGAYPPDQITGDTDPVVKQSTIKSTICVANYTASVRSVSEATRAAILERERATEPSEVDHFISLEIGGSNNPERNLWAEPYAGKYGARVKDVVETHLHREICNGGMTLKQAQDCITTDWIACGQTHGWIK